MFYSLILVSSQFFSPLPTAAISDRSWAPPSLHCTLGWTSLSTTDHPLGPSLLGLFPAQCLAASQRTGLWCGFLETPDPKWALLGGTCCHVLDTEWVESRACLPTHVDTAILGFWPCLLGPWMVFVSPSVSSPFSLLPPVWPNI